jgi:dihydroflavonol-4-reductase
MTAANWTIDKFFRQLEGITGVKAPVLKLPDSAARMAARVMQWGYETAGRTPPVDRISVEMSQHYWYVDATRARSELGFSPRDPDDTLRETVEDLRNRYGLPVN